MCTDPVCVGSFGSEVILPSNGGKPAVLLAITTAAAPAACPTYALWTRAHGPVVPTAGPPRRTRTIVLLRSVPVGYSDKKQPSAIEPSAFFSTRILSGLARQSQPPLASIPVTPCGLNVAAGNVGVASSAADRQHAAGRARRAYDVGAGAVVPGRRNDRDAVVHSVLRCGRARIVVSAERRTDRHADDVDLRPRVTRRLALCDRHIDGVDEHVRRAGATEDAVLVEVGLRRDARADVPTMRTDRVGVVRSRVRLSVACHAKARERACGVRAVTAAEIGCAVERVGVGYGRVVAPRPGCRHRPRGRSRPSPSERSARTSVGSAGAVSCAAAAWNAAGVPGPPKSACV